MKLVKIVTDNVTIKAASPLTKTLENPARNASYLARDTKQRQLLINTHPLRGKTTKNAFQHPSYTKILCKEPCGPIKESTDVGHAFTHDSTVPKATYVADIALDGKTKTQYGVFYEEPIPTSTA